MNYGFLTTETNSNALYIFHGFHHLISKAIFKEYPSLYGSSLVTVQAVGALGERSDKSDFSLLPWDSFSQEIRNLLLFYCQKSLNLLQMQ